MFKSMDTDNSGTITYEELRNGLPKLGTKLSESEVRQLMEAVFYLSCICNVNLFVLLLLISSVAAARYISRVCMPWHFEDLSMAQVK